MPVTELLVIQYLVDATRLPSGGLLWQPLDSGGYRTEVKGVRVELTQSHSSTGVRLYVLLAAGVEKIYVAEPVSVSVWRNSYSTEDERRLAEQMNALFQTVSAQCAAREARSRDQQDRLRQEIFQQLLFGVCHGADRNQSS